ncbi:hypothetical protein [Dactylosporangium sp. CA-233914]|uniref:hypothetical protein n=1 Tax=Dactylosporangium sp. CA-233914 TaxID=3239934 RepID=UPI003D8D0755
MRTYGTRSATGYGYSLWEFQVFGTAAGTGPSGVPSQPAGTAPPTWPGYAIRP